MTAKTILAAFAVALMAVSGCSKQAEPPAPSAAHAVTQESLTREQVENLFRRSYQYVAMFNVIQKGALDPVSGGMFTDGFNKPTAMTALADATVKAIARPNNDTLYQITTLDLSRAPVIVQFPAIDSVYVALETSGYDHYCEVPLATSKGDFKQPVNMLFHTDRTENYQGQAIKGVDRIEKVDSDFTVAFLRAMPHQSDPARMARIIQALKDVKVVTLAEFQGQPATDVGGAKFPAHRKTDGDVFATNLLEVMRFVFNHDAAKVAMVDGALFREVAAEVAKQALAAQGTGGPRDASHSISSWTDRPARLPGPLYPCQDQGREADARLRAADEQGRTAARQGIRDDSLEAARRTHFGITVVRRSAKEHTA